MEIDITPLKDEVMDIEVNEEDEGMDIKINEEEEMLGEDEILSDDSCYNSDMEKVVIEKISR